MNRKFLGNKYNNFMGYLLSAIICTFLYNLTMFMPITGFLLLVYKIKNVSILDKKKWIIVNLLIFFFIGGFSIHLTSSNNISVDLFDPESIQNLLAYILIFLPIELLYSILNSRKFLIPVFDRIIITSLIVTATACIYLNFLHIDMEIVKNILQQVDNLDKKKVAYVMSFIKNNKFYLIYTYVGLIIYLTYYSLGKRSYPYWRISYLWLILYMVPFYLIKFAHINNIYLTNIMMIIKLSFVIYGIKTIYSFIRKRIKLDLLCHILAIIIGFNFQNITFIIAGILSFEAIKIRIIKQK